MKLCLDSFVLMSHGAARLYTLQCSVMPRRAITHQNLQILISQNMILKKKSSPFKTRNPVQVLPDK